jgi:hypothetical protein
MSGRSLCFGTLAAVLVLIGSGCGSGAPKLHKVNGKVTLDGQPLAGAEIEFEPLDYSTGLQSANGKTGQDGYYSLTTFVTGDGAMPGNYKVIITKGPESKGGMERPANLGDGKGAVNMGQMMQKMSQASKGAPALPKSDLHSDYSSREKTILKMTVPPPDGHADFALKKGGGS